MRFVAICDEGGLIPYDLLEKIANEEIEGQRPADFGLPKGRRVPDEIQRVWSDAQELWNRFKYGQEKLPEKDPYGTSLTRDHWIGPLLTDPVRLSYDLKFQPSATVLNGLTFPISHRAGEMEDSPPIHIEGFKIELDRKAPKHRTSPQAMVKEFLNHSEQHVWGVVTNGLSFRLVRCSARTARPSYLEFDLETILQGGHFNEFALFYRVCHRTRLPGPAQPPEECLLEHYYRLSIEQGSRALEKLRDGVEDALKILGTGFLRHPDNEALREKASRGKLTPAEYHRQLLSLVYRLLFLIIAEERRLIVATGENTERNQIIYRDHYSISQLRERAEGIIEQSEFSDLWLGLNHTFSLFSNSCDTNPLAIPPLNGDLFNHSTMPDLEGTQLYNHDLLRAIRRLTLFREGNIQQRVNYSALGAEELGSVYESLLDFRPVVTKAAEGWEFKLESGSERKTTGSYYTRPELVRELIHSTLIPVLEDRLTEAEKQTKGKLREEVRNAKEKAVLSMTVCDPACGSGHFLLETARRLGKELARIRTEEDEPSSEQFHLAVRDVISHCVYGVDQNPLAVDLCKLALWLEGHWAGKPLSFLDYRIKCGNSLIGVLDFDVLEKGIPDEVFNPVTGDDKKVVAAFKKRNRKERESPQRQLDFESALLEHLEEYATQLGKQMAFPEDTPADVKRKAELYHRLRQGRDWLHDWTAANVWTAAFFLAATNLSDPAVPTYGPFMDYFLQNRDRPQMTVRANALALELKFFHWQLEFPAVSEKGGFDIVLGNPPWERIKLQEEEQWADDPYIANAPNKAERSQRIEKYRRSNDPAKQARIARFHAAKHAAEATSKFVRVSSRFPLTAVGDINTYALFADLARTLLNKRGRAGIIVPTGIATDDTTKEFFADLNQNRGLASLYDFENRERIFPDVDSRMKFSLLTFSARPVSAATFACFLTRTEQMRDPVRRFELAPEDFALLNPNTRTCPVFRTRADAELTKKIYRRVPVLVNETTGENPWGVKFMTMFHMSNDSHLFHMEPGPGLLPLYEAKMMHQFDHHFATYESGETRDCKEEEKADPSFTLRPRYWVPKQDVEARLGEWKHGWLLGFRDITNATNERTAIFSIIPRAGVGNTMPLVFHNAANTAQTLCFLANANSLVFDYVSRQKIGGTHLTYNYLNQLPVLPPRSYCASDQEFVVGRVTELVYTAADLEPLAKDAGCKSEPFHWGENHRAQLRAELDAYYAHLYGLTRDELRYILDPKDVFGPDFPGETFRVLKGNEEKKYGEYRTWRLVLASFDDLARTERFAGEKREPMIEAPKGRALVPVG